MKALYNINLVSAGSSTQKESTMEEIKYDECISGKYRKLEILVSVMPSLKLDMMVDINTPYTVVIVQLKPKDLCSLCLFSLSNEQHIYTLMCVKE